MAASLTKFGEPIGNRPMVLMLLRGLSGMFRHMVSILKMRRTFSTFSEARTHLLLEEMEIDARPSSPSATLVAATPCQQPSTQLLHARARPLRSDLLHQMANPMTSATASVMAMVAAVALLVVPPQLLVRPRLDRTAPFPMQACTRRSPIHGTAPCACGRTTHRGTLCAIACVPVTPGKKT